ncbi:hypothetical protein [Nonomuraea typhae]|uniref:Uncharacterized protein n=1 Tax=Nonomuraea typhae TaxID=2603600 RepID=A0ABW7Z7A5_9ACTN
MATGTKGTAPESSPPLSRIPTLPPAYGRVASTISSWATSAYPAKDVRLGNSSGVTGS